MIRHTRHHYIDSAYMYGFAVISIILLSNFHSHTFKKMESNVVQKNNPSASQLFKKESFAHISIQGKAFVVYDIVEGKVIAEKNGEMIVPLASITKVMTAVTARSHYSKNTKIIVDAKSIDGSYDLGLKNKQVFDLDELLKYTLVFSSNDGAQIVADGLGGRSHFISVMNSDAHNLGLDMKFNHPAGLDEGTLMGGTGSALSVARLTAIAHTKFPELFDATTKTRVSVQSSTGKIIGIPNTNQSVTSFPGITFSKTGYTESAGGNLVVIVDIVIGHPVAIVVLGSTREGRFSDVEKLYTALQESVK